jgi:hypothetical protein
MSSILIGAIVAGVAIGLVLLRWTIRYGAPRAGDFVKVAIPRMLDKPLAMGTRLDIAAALKKAGTRREELAPLCDGAHDRELLDRYWAMKDQAG